MTAEAPDTAESVQNTLLTIIGNILDCNETERKALVGLFAQLLNPSGMEVAPASVLRKILHEAATRAGWNAPSAKAQHRQQVAALGRKKQRQEDLALRRILVCHVFKDLPRRLRKEPGSLGTAQAVIGRLEKLAFDRRPPITVRTIQEDIRFMRENGNFGI
jgi:hypothetical protein